MASFIRRTGRLVTSASAVVLGGYCAYQLKSRPLTSFAEAKKDEQWHQVGQVSNLHCYPVKSCANVPVTQLFASKMGAVSGSLRDRVFMIVNESGECCTARSYPKFVLISAEINGDHVVLTAPGRDPLTFNTREVVDASTARTNVTVWESKLDVFDCGDVAADWITSFGSSGGTKLRLVYYPDEECRRILRQRHLKYSEMKSDDIGALQDATSFMVVNKSSVDDLNQRLKKIQVDSVHFRPNIIVEGAAPYDEDKWQQIRIGDDEVTLKFMKPCTRGTFTMVDQSTAEPYPDGEPLATLNTYRFIDGAPDGPVMGVNVGVISEGNVKIGDKVYVKYK